MKMTTREHRSQIHKRIRKKISGTAARPRLSVFRSNVGIYCQLIDDVTGTTLCAASHKEVETAGNKSDISKSVGKALATKAVAAGVSAVVFDRSGYLYHGRIKAVAEGAREGGLQF
jgi:large subunit ribosomal protein L18